MNNVLIIFGATGDLMDRKISPALYGLNKEKPGVFHKIIGFGRRDLSNEEFRELVKKSVEKKSDIKKNDINEFLSMIEYHKGEFHDLESFKSLNIKIKQDYLEASKHIYLAIPPELYQIVIENLGNSGFVEPTTKLMVEKPVGRDLESSKQTEELFSKYFNEEQIYRIDHYLGKDSVQNILSFRFANSMFDPIWDNKHIEKIEIRINETLGIDNRGAFYDTLGALRDVGQNHLLQMLALTTMDEPSVLCCENIRFNRTDLLKMLKPLTHDEIRTNTFRAQYNGYKDVTGVAKNSNMETYFKLKCFIDSKRWEGVPFYLEAGKSLKNVHKEVIVHFKGINKVIFSLEPDDSIKIFVKTKKPGITFENEDNMITLMMKESENKNTYVAEYTQLLHDFFIGDQTFFVCKDESMYMWEFIQPILDGWKDNVVKLETYEADSDDIILKANEKLK